MVPLGPPGVPGVLLGVQSHKLLLGITGYDPILTLQLHKNNFLQRLQGHSHSLHSQAQFHSRESMSVKAETQWICVISLMSKFRSLKIGDNQGRQVSLEGLKYVFLDAFDSSFLSRVLNTEIISVVWKNLHVGDWGWLSISMSKCLPCRLDKAVSWISALTTWANVIPMTLMFENPWHYYSVLALQRGSHCIQDNVWEPQLGRVTSGKHHVISAAWALWLKHMIMCVARIEWGLSEHICESCNLMWNPPELPITNTKDVWAPKS